MSAEPSILRRGAGITLAQALHGGAISAPRRRQVRHPWFTSPSYLGSAEQWVATVDVGMVDEEVPIYRATIAEQKANGNPWENNPLTGKQFFSASVFAQSETTVAAQTLDLPLYLAPSITLSFRAIGFDGDPQFPVPEYFLQKGAANPPPQPSGDDLLSGNTAAVLQSTPAPKNLRLLRVCDIWVHMPRLALTSSVDLNPAGALTGQATVIQTLGVRSPSATDTLQVMAGTFVPSTVTIDPLSNDYEEPNYDELLISQVFLLSAPNAPVGSAANGSWQPYVRHALFEQLSYVPTFFHAPNLDIENLTIPPLAAGAGTLIISSFDSQIANASGTAADVLAASSLAGTWFTPTGGGHSANLPTTTPAQPSTGLNKAAALNALAAQAAAAQRATLLEPAFPWQAIAFTPSLLTP
jgi:hypothetical protein